MAICLKSQDTEERGNSEPSKNDSASFGWDEGITLIFGGAKLFNSAKDGRV